MCHSVGKEIFLLLSISDQWLCVVENVEKRPCIVWDAIGPCVYTSICELVCSYLTQRVYLNMILFWLLFYLFFRHFIGMGSSAYRIFCDYIRQKEEEEEENFHFRFFRGTFFSSFLLKFNLDFRKAQKKINFFLVFPSLSLFWFFFFLPFSPVPTLSILIRNYFYPSIASTESIFFIRRFLWWIEIDGHESAAKLVSIYWNSNAVRAVCLFVLYVVFWLHVVIVYQRELVKHWLLSARNR